MRPSTNQAPVRTRGATVLEVALRYAELGYRVFPLQQNSKVPATARGFKDATTDAATIRAAFTGSRNVAIAPGPITLVLDFDVSKDEAIPIGDRLNEVRRQYRLLSETFPEAAEAPMSLTPSRGLHVWLQVPLEAPHLTTGKWEAGDLRGLGRSYVAVPPSTIDGKQYRWLRPLVPGHLLPVASPALLDYLTPARTPTVNQVVRTPSRERLSAYVWAALSGEHKAVASVPDNSGSCNDTLHKSAVKLGSLVGAGVLTEDDARDALLDACRINRHPLHEALPTIASGMKFGKAHPRQLDKEAS